MKISSQCHTHQLKSKPIKTCCTPGIVRDMEIKPQWGNTAAVWKAILSLQRKTVEKTQRKENIHGADEMKMLKITVERSMELPLLIFSKTNILIPAQVTGGLKTCPAQRSPIVSTNKGRRCLNSGLTWSSRQPRRGTHQSSLCLVRRLTRLPHHSKGLLNSKFILHREEERIRHKLNQVSLFLNIKSEG